MFSRGRGGVAHELREGEAAVAQAEEVEAAAGGSGAPSLAQSSASAPARGLVSDAQGKQGRQGGAFHGQARAPTSLCRASWRCRPCTQPRATSASSACIRILGNT